MGSSSWGLFASAEDLLMKEAGGLALSGFSKPWA